MNSANNNKPGSNGRPQSRNASSSGGNSPAAANGKQRPDSRSDSGNNNNMQSAFSTLKKNADVLSSQTPEPGQLEVIFNSEDHPLSESTNAGGDAAKKDGDTEGKEPESQSAPDQKETEKQQQQEPKVAPAPPANSDEVPVSKEIASKLRKFRKYEEKYPGEYISYFSFQCILLTFYRTFKGIPTREEKVRAHQHL